MPVSPKFFNFHALYFLYIMPNCDSVQYYNANSLSQTESQRIAASINHLPVCPLLEQLYHVLRLANE